MSKSNLLTMAQAADVLGLSRERVRQLVDAGKIPVAQQVGRMRLLHRDDVAAFRPPGQGWRKGRTGGHLGNPEKKS